MTAEWIGRELPAPAPSEAVAAVPLELPLVQVVKARG
jgi:hypothetical protein